MDKYLSRIKRNNLDFVNTFDPYFFHVFPYLASSIYWHKFVLFVKVTNQFFSRFNFIEINRNLSNWNLGHDSLPARTDRAYVALKEVTPGF